MPFSTDNKRIIRSLWSKPLLKFICKQLNSKLIYFGLPSPQTQDVNEWIEYIDKVIAFQCDDDRYPNAYQELYDALKLLEDQQKISTFNAFNGYLEEVILQGYDNSESTQLFEINEIITLYNLDFCNSIDSPIEIQDKNGKLKKVYKFDAINKLLETQKSLSDISSKFILFLTVQCSYKGGELELYLNHSQHKEYIAQIRGNLKSHQLNARIVRLFVVDTLSIYFRTFGFTPKFFPTIYYEGDGGIPLLHFTIIGSRNESAGATVWFQNIIDIINSKFVTLTEENFINQNTENVEEQDIAILNPVDFFVSSNSFKTIWKKKTVI